jgi:hypothetical protein
MRMFFHSIHVTMNARDTFDSRLDRIAADNVRLPLDEAKNTSADEALLLGHNETYGTDMKLSDILL